MHGELTLGRSILDAARYRACASRLDAARYRACASRTAPTVTLSELEAAARALHRRIEILSVHESRRRTVCFLKNRSGKVRWPCGLLDRNLFLAGPLW